MPDTVTAALLAAAIAALGYVAKLLVQDSREARKRRGDRVARLIELNSLLRATAVAFRTQLVLAHKLAETLRTKHPELAGDEGFENLFNTLYDSFTPEEAEQHRVIRGYTEHTLRPMNEAISAWLREERDLGLYRAPRRFGLRRFGLGRRRRKRVGPSGRTGAPGSQAVGTDAGSVDTRELHARLARSLADLETHLHLWHAKYATWVVDQPNHALVFLAGESEFGIGFPRDLERDVLAVIDAESHRTFAGRTS